MDCDESLASFHGDRHKYLRYQHNSSQTPILLAIISLYPLCPPIVSKQYCRWRSLSLGESTLPAQANYLLSDYRHCLTGVTATP